MANGMCMSQVEVNVPVDLLDRLRERAAVARLPVESYMSLMLWRAERYEREKSSNQTEAGGSVYGRRTCPNCNRPDWQECTDPHLSRRDNEGYAR